MATLPLPWRYPYLHDKPRKREVLRPIVSVQLFGADLSSAVKGLVESGSEHVLAAPWLASDAKIDLEAPKYEIDLGIAGGNPNVRFVDMTLRLLHPHGDDNDYIEWEAEVGFPDVWRPAWPVLLGQVGFFDRFTVNMHRAARTVVIEEWDAFDRRWGVAPDERAIPPREMP